MESLRADLAGSSGDGAPRAAANRAAVFAVALAPALAVHLYAFRTEIVNAGAVPVASLALCAAAAVAVSRALGNATRLLPSGDAVVTGLLLPFCLPALPAYWLLALGAVLAIGLGRLEVPRVATCLLQPLVLTRVLLRLAFPQEMGAAAGIDAISGATALGLRTMQEFLTSAAGAPSPELYLGIASGTLAATMGLPLVAGGLYLVARGAVGWRIPAAFLASVVLFSSGAWILDGPRFLSPPYHLFGGDLIMGAFFLATDPRTSPRRRRAQVVFGLGCGGITVAARMAGSFPESVPLAILAMNLCSPFLDRLPVRESARLAGAPSAPRGWGARLAGSPRRRLAVLATALGVTAAIAVAAWPRIRNLAAAREAAKAEAFAAIMRAQPDDRPLEWVYSVPAGLSFTRSEVTVAQFGQCVRAGGCEKKFEIASQQPNCNVGYPGRRAHPMNCVTWKTAAQFCAWAGGRLPNESEWYAEASNGGSRVYPWGDEEATCDRAVRRDAVLGDGCGEGRTWPVCSKPLGLSVSGLCDMAGNVWEWTATEQRNEYFFTRGGGWNVGREENMRSSARSYLGAYFRGFGSVGFRCVREAPSR